MATLEANVTALEKELIVFQDGCPELLEMDDPLSEQLDTTVSDPASNRPSRIPLLMSVGGTFQQYSPDGGAIGGTGGPNFQVATLNPIYFNSGYSYTKLAEFATTGAERSVSTITGQVMLLSSRQHRTYMDMLMNTAGNGVVGTVTSLSTTTLTNDTITMTSDGFDEELFMVGQNIRVYDSGLTTNRGGANVLSIDHINHKIVVDATIALIAPTDKIVIGGLSGTLTINSSLFGIQYHQSNAISGTWLGLSRTTYPQIATPAVNAGSSALTPGFIRYALNLVRMNLGDKYFKSAKAKLAAYTHPSQADAYEAAAIAISNIWKDPSGNQNIDLLFNQEGLRMSNVPVIQSIHQDRTRIDFLALGNWGRIIGANSGLLDLGGGRYLWPKIDISTGSPTTTLQFWMNSGLQLYNKNPAGSSYIYGLGRPTLNGVSVY